MANEEKHAVPTTLKVQMLPGGCVAVAVVRYGPHEFCVREGGWCQSLHRTYTEALTAFNARVMGSGS
jgi:hypothetical protein